MDYTIESDKIYLSFEIASEVVKDYVFGELQKNPHASIHKVKKNIIALNPNIGKDKFFLNTYPSIYVMATIQRKIS